MKMYFAYLRPARWLFLGILAAVVLAGAAGDSRADDGGAQAAVRAQELLARTRLRHIRFEERMSLCLGAARATLPGMLAGNERDAGIYAEAVAQLVGALRPGRFADRNVSGTGGSYRLVIPRSGGHRLDPAAANEVVWAAEVRLDGLPPRATEAGLGVPFVFSYLPGSKFLQGQPGISRAGISLAVTACLDFEGGEARLSFYDRLDRDDIEVNGRERTLAANFSAAIARVVSRTPNRPFDIPGLLFTRQHLANAGLYQFQPYDPGRIPVILVHGLFSRPEAWTPVLNALMADRRVRERYQFWFFLYPSGLPIWQSSMLLRTDLDRFHRELERNGRQPNLHRIVLVGHSMGGLVSSLVVREPGQSFWARLSDRSLEELDISPEARSLVKDMVKFQPRRDIARVVYVTTPHRGSPIPHNPVIGQAIRFIQMPRTFSRADRQVLVGAIREDLRGLFTLPANSIRFLKSGSPLLEAVETLPLSARIPYHSIIGDRGRGDSPNSTDGIVPFWSSHMDSAVSEKIIPRDHSAPRYPETAREIRRILLDSAPD